MAVQSYWTKDQIDPFDPIPYFGEERYVEVGDAIRIEGQLATYYGTCTAINEVTERMEVRYYDEIRGKFLEHIWVDSEIVYVVLKSVALTAVQTANA